MMKKLFFAFIVFSMLLVGCGDKEKESSSNPNEQEVIRPDEKEIEEKREGPYKEYYPGTKQVKIEGDYFQGKKHGLWKSYYENGLKWSETSYNGGVLHGKTATFHPTGHLKYIGYYDYGKKVGVWMFYDENGEFVKEEEFK